MKRPPPAARRSSRRSCNRSSACLCAFLLINCATCATTRANSKEPVKTQIETVLTNLAVARLAGGIDYAWASRWM